MKDTSFEIISNVSLAPSIFRMVLKGDCTDIKGSGQFVEITLEGMFLRRPISVCDRKEGELTIIYKTVGKGTSLLSGMKAGEKLQILTGLGNGYDTAACKSHALLIGGGVGTPPMYLLAKELLAQGKKVSLVLGFNTAKEIFLDKEMQELGIKPVISTVDGSFGVKGFVTDAIREKGIQADYFYACGPKPMLKALCDSLEISGELSLEERMGCGTGICYGCSCQTTKGPKRVCKDGPVFKKEEIIW